MVMRLFKLIFSKKDENLNNSSEKNNYFEQATAWSNDRYHSIELSRNRYRVAFYSMSGIVCMMAMAIATMMPLKKLVPIIIHKNDATGEVWVEPLKTPYAPANEAEIKSQLARYVMARESYSMVDYNYRYGEVQLQSNERVSKQYAKEQAIANPTSQLNQLAENGIRSVHIEDVILLDKAGLPTGDRTNRTIPSRNLAQVNFSTTDMINGSTHKNYYVATISWDYQGMPSNPMAALENWNGFTVNYYRVDPRTAPH